VRCRYVCIYPRAPAAKMLLIALERLICSHAPLTAVCKNLQNANAEKRYKNKLYKSRVLCVSLSRPVKNKS